MKKILFALISLLIVSCTNKEQPTLVQLTSGAIGVTDSCVYLLSTIDDTDTITVVDFMQRIRMNDKGVYLISSRMLKGPRFIFDYGSGAIVDGRIAHNYGVDFDFSTKIDGEYVYFAPWQSIKATFYGLEQVRLYYNDEKYQNEQDFEPDEIKQYLDILFYHMMSN